MNSANTIRQSEILPIPDAARVTGAEECQVAIDGVTWRYLRSGSGPPLLLVHGLMGYSWSWRFNMQELGQHFTVYAPDLPGCGFSQRASTLPGSLESDAEALLKFVDHFGIEQFDLLWTSRGGGVSIVFAALLAQRNQQHRIKRFILSAPINPWSKFGQMRARLLATGVGRLYAIHVIPRQPGLLKKYFRALYGDAARIVPGGAEGYEAGLRPPGSFQHLARIMRVWHADLRQVEASLPLLQQLPILLLWGSRDTAVFPSSAYALHRRLKNSAVLMMDTVGHMPYEEVPEDFNRILCDFFLRGQPPTPLELADQNDNAVPVATGGAPANDSRRDLAP